MSLNVKVDERFGLFSEQAARLYGSDFYIDENGQEVEVSCLGVSESEYQWPDKVVRGRLGRWSRCGRLGTVPLTPVSPLSFATLKYRPPPRGVTYHVITRLPGRDEK